MVGLCRATGFLIIILSMLFAQGESETESNLAPDSKGLEYYESILQKYPSMAEAHFGVGHSAYIMSDYKQALSEFESSLTSDDKRLKSKIFYNIGNTLFQQGRYQESSASFRKALELNPGDVDAKYNYELCCLMLQQMKQQQSSESEQSQEQDSTYNQEKPQTKPQEGEEQKESQPQQIPQDEQTSEEQQSQPQLEEMKEEDNRPDPPAPSEGGPASPPNFRDGAGWRTGVEAILNALKADEKNLMKRRLETAQSKKLEKDW